MASFKRRVIIDIGHGWYAETGRFDPGVVLPCGTNEYMLNATAGAACLRDLLAAGYAAEFVPLGLPLFERGRRAVDFDVFLSIHHNALNGLAQGTEVCVHDSKATDADLKLAAAISKSVSAELKIKDRGILRSPLSVLSGARKSNARACVLSEGFFMDAPMPNSEIFRMAQLEGAVLARAIREYLESA
jgi:N-acetylmuramoyl-L-alanine amidase